MRNYMGSLPVDVKTMVVPCMTSIWRETGQHLSSKLKYPFADQQYPETANGTTSA